MSRFWFSIRWASGPSTLTAKTAFRSAFAFPMERMSRRPVWERTGEKVVGRGAREFLAQRALTAAVRYGRADCRSKLVAGRVYKLFKAHRAASLSMVISIGI